MSEMVSVVEYFQMLAVAVLVGKVVLLSFMSRSAKWFVNYFQRITHWAWERPSWDWSP